MARRTLVELQKSLSDHGLDGLLIRSTDRYFNEYVPRDLSIRAQLTGFDGSVGDAIITKTEAHLFVDGRYTLQARSQAVGYTVHVCSNAQSIEMNWLKALEHLLHSGDVLAYDPATVDLDLFSKLSTRMANINVSLTENASTIFKELLLEDSSPEISHRIINISESLSGTSFAHKLEGLASTLTAHGVDGFLSVKLDDIAWLTNLRSYIFPYQASIPGIACIFRDGVIFGTDHVNPLAIDVDKRLSIVKESELFQAIKQRSGSPKVIGIDKTETSKAHELALQRLNFELKEVDNPITFLKAIKNEKELLHLRSAFKKADHVVYQTQNFVVESMEKERALTEADVDHHLKSEFEKSGAEALSFRPICASGKNGAVIHYGTPDNKEKIARGSLFLLDTGGYYEGGYATDLTRTFLVDKSSATASPWQKEMFTLVLKASIKGLSARLKKGSVGQQLDAIVRAPLWQASVDYAHGTGHGVGINVHEFPPRIGPGSLSPLLEGQVFSIEPGLYFEGIGGVRIENLATIVADPEDNAFIRVLPLTFCPLDERLIDNAMLDDDDHLFLEYYRQEWQSPASWPRLPPTTAIKFIKR